MELFGKEITNIVIPFNNDQLQFLLQNSDDWQVALIDFRGQILFHLPSSSFLHFLKTHSVIFLRKFYIQPLEGAILVFTDGSSNGKAVTIINRKSHVQVTEEKSAHKAELRAVIWAFQHLRDNTFNLRRGQWHPTPVLLPGNSHGQRSLVGYSQWGREESDMTERLHFHFSL